MLRVVAKVVLVNPQGHILMLKRSKTCKYAPGKVDFPGGGIEPGEDIVAAAIREAQEEAGLTLAPEDLQVAYSYTSQPNADGDIITRILLMGHVKNADVQLSYEHDAFWWHNPAEELTDFDHISWGDGLRFSIEHDLLRAYNEAPNE